MSSQARLQTPGIVADGYVRAQAACEPAIREAVEREFEPLLLRATFWSGWLLRLAREREIRRRLNGLAPPNGLY
jgi:hypothetical protein